MRRAIRFAMMSEAGVLAKFAFAAMLAGFVAGAAHASPVSPMPVNLVANGDFSSSTYTTNNQFGAGYGGQGVTGWTGNGGYNLYFFAGTATTVSANSQYGGGREDLWGVTGSPTGGNFVALDGASGVQGGISQSVSGLTPGETYALTFSWGAGQIQSRNGATTEQLRASLGNQFYLTNVVSNPSHGFTGWFTTTFDYTATAGNEVLSFLSVGTPSGLPPIATLDGVSLVEVPEPGSIGVLAFGLGLVGFCWLRRRLAHRA